MNQELLLISIYCMVDDFCAQPQVACQLIRPGRKPKLADVSLLTLSLLQEFTGIHDEDDYWRYVHASFVSYFPGQLVDRTQYNRRKKNLSALINQFRAQVARRLPLPEPLHGYHVIDAVGMAAAPNGQGYWLVASDGGIFAFNAAFLGSMGAVRLNQPVVGMTGSPDGGGYRMVASDGGVFSFGDAPFYGSLGNFPLPGGTYIINNARTLDNRGYFLLDDYGQVFAFGDASCADSADCIAVGP